MMKSMLIGLAALLCCSIPAIGQETPQEKYICEVQAGNCLKRTDVIQRKMKKLEKEIKRGKCYSVDDLKQIEMKLKEVEQMLDNLKAREAK